MGRIGIPPTRRRVISLVVTVATPVAGCSTAKAGTALPRGEDAAAYVSARCADTLDKLQQDFNSKKPRKSTLNKLFRINDQRVDSTITTVTVGDPPSQLVRNHSNVNLNEYSDYPTLSGQVVECQLLGPLFAGLAPTPWVALPHDPGGYGACTTGTYIVACKMTDAMVDATEHAKAAKRAKRLPDGSVEVEVDISLRTFLEHRIVAFTDEVVAQMSDDMLNTRIACRITLTPEQALKQIEMNSTFATKNKKGKDLQGEIRFRYRTAEGATPADIPAPPDPSQVAVISDPAAVADFRARKQKILDE